MFVRNEWKEHIKIRHDLSCENFLWWKMSKTFFGLQDDLYVGVIYFPPESSTREKKVNLDHFQHLEEITKQIDSDQIIQSRGPRVFYARTLKDDSRDEDKNITQKM